MKHLLLSLVTAAAATTIFSCNPSDTAEASYNVVPLPNGIELLPDKTPFILNSSTEIVYAGTDTAMIRNARFLAEYISTATGLTPDIVTTPSSANNITLSDNLESDNREAYCLTVDENGIVIDGASPAGTFYGIQTIRKSMPAENSTDVVFPAVVINDSPRFSYRGGMLDVSRHFFPVDTVKRFIDLLALHNVNQFHWHLSDDQGWRIEIKSRPLLTEKGSMRPETVIGHNTPEYDGTPHGGFYTREEAREIVRYAADRYINVIPEIDLPGHMQAALAAYPELGCTGGPYSVWNIWGVSEEVLCAGNDSTYRFIEDVLGEIVDIFPSEYIHIGGDECPKTRWKNCAKCQHKIKSLGLRADNGHTAEQRLQSHITSFAEKFLNEHGRRLIGWDEILEGGVSDKATVVSWRGEEGGILEAMHVNDVIMAPHNYLYFDYYQNDNLDEEPDGFGSVVPVEKVYSYEPAPASATDEQRRHIIGVQANLWTAYVPTFSLAEYMMLPRMAAAAEIQWTMPEKKDYNSFLNRTARLMKTYDSLGYRYATHIFDVRADISPMHEHGAVEVVLNTMNSDPIHFTLDGTEPTEKSQLYSEPLLIDSTCTLKAKAFHPSGESRVFTERLNFHKGSMKPVSINNEPAEKYRYNGASTLVDALNGNSSFKSGRWIGFIGNDLDATVDLGEPTEISSAGVNCCIVKNEWIFDTRKITVYVSDDGKSFRQTATEDYPQLTRASRDGVYRHTLTFPPTTARYVKVVAESEKRPEGYEAHGMGYMLVDEIEIR